MAICLVVVALIEAETTVLAFFEETVRDAAVARGQDPASARARYLAGLLADYARPEALRREVLRQPITFAYRDALAAAGPERFRRLRELGDDTLYFSGFFADHLTRRGVPLTLVQGLGRAAYDAAGRMLRRGRGDTRGPDVFDELATHFDELTVVLGDVSDALYANRARDARGILDVYERWERRGSQALAGVLLGWGLLPTRGSDQLH